MTNVNDILEREGMMDFYKTADDLVKACEKNDAQLIAMATARNRILNQALKTYLGREFFPPSVKYDLVSVDYRNDQLERITFLIGGTVHVYICSGSLVIQGPDMNPNAIDIARDLYVIAQEKVFVR